MAHGQSAGHIRAGHDLFGCLPHACDERLLGVPAIRHEEAAEGRDRIQEIVFPLVGAEVPFLEATEALVGRDLSIGLEADILERICGTLGCAREEVVGTDAELPEMTSGDACLGMAAFGQRRVASALVLVVDIEERLAVAHEIERLHGFSFLWLCGKSIAGAASGHLHLEQWALCPGLRCLPVAGCEASGYGCKQHGCCWHEEHGGDVLHKQAEEGRR